MAITTLLPCMMFCLGLGRWNLSNEMAHFLLSCCRKTINRADQKAGYHFNQGPGILIAQINVLSKVCLFLLLTAGLHNTSEWKYFKTGMSMEIVGWFFFSRRVLIFFFSPFVLFNEYPLSRKRPYFQKNLGTNRWVSTVKRTWETKISNHIFKRAQHILKCLKTLDYVMWQRELSCWVLSSSENLTLL